MTRAIKIKIVLLLMIVAMSITSKFAFPQNLIIGIGGGTNNKLSPFLEGKIGYRLPSKIGISYHQILMVLPSEPAYFGGIMDYELNDIVTLGGGMMYRLQTTDRFTEFGKYNYWTARLFASFRINNLLINTSYINKQIALSLGVGF